VITTLISEGCVLEGNLKAPAFVRLDGQIAGDIIADEGLIVGEKGVIIGNTVTKEMIVYGTVKGNINAYSLEVRNTGRINGEVKAQLLQVATGGSLHGKLSMSANIKQEKEKQEALTQVSSKPEKEKNGALTPINDKPEKGKLEIAPSVNGKQPKENPELVNA